ncbi:uncharacterized protein I206_105214 [Kwoniella pini CBS 10737]|uniref:Uncharacterized protein n=1 Tax=Kwoniella pini CBS 10737 TaxID=1296096 RepID=A0A1B9I4V3_9TREE|nr:uncharacterized protein I206_03877 [Kwoniella pini CBS 10737]OCF50552.1 hypothetical protein I206_03877 [Kwoniella pini CBS 10737]
MPCSLPSVKFPSVRHEAEDASLKLHYEGTLSDQSGDDTKYPVQIVTIHSLLTKRLDPNSEYCPTAEECEALDKVCVENRTNETTRSIGVNIVKTGNIDPTKPSGRHKFQVFAGDLVEDYRNSLFFVPISEDGKGMRKTWLMNRENHGRSMWSTVTAKEEVSTLMENTITHAYRVDEEGGITREIPTITPIPWPIEGSVVDRVDLHTDIMENDRSDSWWRSHESDRVKDTACTLNVTALIPHDESEQKNTKAPILFLHGQVDVSQDKTDQWWDGPITWYTPEQAA